ncbi:MAG TPA: hypothetical protein VK541_09570 [Pedobacter sp.]|uniref:hypothetical protein n=1 Tax=Pedobacter sp. TaxID=1411316 RepID=UPI002C481FE3|nr:hypothetical protein [Pedobacter sp.]HMI02719.1 hypothetical protein [Pedobacter sp.]
MNYNQIPTYIINLKKRPDRKESILNEFKDKEEFALNIVEAFEDKFGALGLWNTIIHILRNLINKDEEFIIIGEDDLEFTNFYSKKILVETIDCAKEKKADIVLGGVSWFSNSIRLSSNLYWVENFSGLQFTIIFRKFFDVILKASLINYEAADYKIASMTSSAMFVYPFITIQKEFGYSDATSNNNENGRVSALFNASTKLVEQTTKISTLYLDNKLSSLHGSKPDLENITIPTYIINLSHNNTKFDLRAEFSGKNEFDLKVIHRYKRNTNLSLWLNIRKIIKSAIKNDDDVIVISSDKHKFTNDYSKEYLLTNIIEGHYSGADFLSGYANDFNKIIPIAKNRFWIDQYHSLQFLIIYRNAFHDILSLPYNKDIVPNKAISNMSLSKMILYPFISEDSPKDSCTEKSNDVKLRFNKIHRAFLRIDKDKLVIANDQNSFGTAEVLADN